MDCVLDEDVKAVAEFMQNQIPASRLVAVAQAVAQIAPLMWSRYQFNPPEEVDAIRLVSQPPIASVCDRHIQSSGTG